MLFILYPALILAFANASATIPPAPSPPVVPLAEPTFDPNAPPSWWTDKMRQPCTKVGDRMVC